jgi:protein-tyrosine phosphatase
VTAQAALRQYAISQGQAGRTVGNTGTTPPVPTRVLLLQGTHNTRQLGGLPVAGGVIKQNMMWRTDALERLSDADMKTLSDLNIQSIADLRTPQEIEKFGKDRYQAANALALPMDYQGPAGTGAEIYRGIMRQNQSAIRGFFGMLADGGSYPLMYHCSAGKDRTGILTALLLDALGTPRDVIMGDYMMSQQYEQVEPAWLQGVFAEVDQAGGIDRYLARCGVTPEQLQSVRQNLVSKG